jgi:hypothetical protein
MRTFFLFLLVCFHTGFANAQTPHFVSDSLARDIEQGLDPVDENMLS